jgi:hypothetical protein
MNLIDIFLALTHSSGRPFGTNKYAAVHEHLTKRFGGLMAFSRSPAQGATSDGRKTVHDQTIVFEVMTDALDVAWWGNYRPHLERGFYQDEIVVRASAVSLL